MSKFSVEELIRQDMDRWADCSGSPEMTLLRLSILRQLIQNLHSEKSRCLASGLKTEAQAIKNWEVQIENLRDHISLQGDLLQLVQESLATPKKKRNLPEALFQNLDRDKLLRYDRKWEAAIAAEAIALNWKFWILDTWVKIPMIEQWDQAFSQRLWPHGLILFAESANAPERENLQDNADLMYWRGRWVTLLHPHFKTPMELSLNLKHWPGAPETPPSLPQWKRIYP
jgi:hypothetical protein